MNVNEKVLKRKIDPYLTEGNLATICSESLGKKVEIKKAYILTGGCLNRVVGVDFKNGDPSIVLKATPSQKDDGLRHEYSVLKYFIDQTRVPVPLPLFYDESSDIIPGTYFVMKKVDGISMHHLDFSLHDIREITEQVAKILIDLHKKKEKGFGGVDLSPDDRATEWADFWLPRFDQVITEVRSGEHVPGALLNRIKKVRPKFETLLKIGHISTLTHYDIWSGNIMLHRNNGGMKVSGLLDVQGYWADYARELSFMEMFGVANDYFYSLYREIHPLDDTFHIRKDLYNLKMHVKHIHMYPDQTVYRHGAEQCLQTLENEINHL
jgi:fructosamine-3-kinase